jgi:hypothetical protein
MSTRLSKMQYDIIQIFLLNMTNMSLTTSLRLSWVNSATHLCACFLLFSINNVLHFNIKTTGFYKYIVHNYARLLQTDTATVTSYQYVTPKLSYYILPLLCAMILRQLNDVIKNCFAPVICPCHAGLC